MILNTIEIVRAQSAREIADIRRLLREYERFLGVDLQFQDFEAELKSLPGRYAALLRQSAAARRLLAPDAERSGCACRAKEAARLLSREIPARSFRVRCAWVRLEIFVLDKTFIYIYIYPSIYRLQR